MAMDMVDVVNRISPVAPDAGAKGANYLAGLRQGGPLFDQNGITTPLRMAHFLAQALHETGCFTVLRESMNYSAPRLSAIFGVGQHSAAITPAEASTLAHHQEDIAERVYGLGNPHKAQELGNTNPGDGFLYRGNGILQMTGRGAHREIGKACGVNFEDNPGLATDPLHILKPGLREWTEEGLNALADKNDIRTITRKINGGFNGLAEREALFDQVFRLLQTGGQPVEALQAGDADDDIITLQQALNTLGADPQLKVDGRFGPSTREAVRDFQTVAGIAADGIPGPVTNAAIKLALDKIR
jgi:putative chitinase